MGNLVLAVDKMGYPVKWVKPQTAVCYYAKGEVMWELGAAVARFRSGISRLTGLQTIISPAAIIGIDGQAIGRIPEATIGMGGKSRSMLFARDRWVCAYCGERFNEVDLSKDHVVPLSKGGSDLWMNLVTACRPCNHRKAARDPQDAGMALLYLPYAPSRYESLILKNRRILADQMDFLMAKVPESSRLWSGHDAQRQNGASLP